MTSISETKNKNAAAANVESSLLANAANERRALSDFDYVIDRIGNAGYGTCT